MPVIRVQNAVPSAGDSYRKDPLYAYAKAFNEAANTILQQESCDIFEEPQKVMRRRTSKNIMKKFFTENMIDPHNVLYDAQDIEDLRENYDMQFENDVKAMYEHTAPVDYNPIIGMALPIHKLILMNNVYDKGGIQKVTAPQPKFPISLERRLLVTPDGKEIDMFLEQNKITDAIDSTNPTKEIELELPVKEDKDIITDEFGGTAMDSLDVSTYICAVQVTGVKIEVGDLVPDENGYITRYCERATEEKTNQTVWFPVNIRFTPNYGGPHHYERATTQPLTITYKSDEGIKEIHPIITGSMNKNRFNIADLSGEITKIRLSAKLDSSNAMLETCHPIWKVDTDLIEIGSATPINTTISPEEMKDVAALYNVNQLTKYMSMINVVLSEYKDMKIKRYLDKSYGALDERNGFYDFFDFAPPSEYALTALEYRHKMFMDFLDRYTTKMLQVLNDPNMTFTIFGDPQIIRMITPKEYSYQAPASIGQVTLDYTQTIVNNSDRRVYNFIGSDKLRNTNELVIILNPHNSERIIYRIYDYQLYVSNEIRNIANPALPSIHAFERWIITEYMPVQGRVKILNETGLRD